jgi:hypothetical protein
MITKNKADIVSSGNQLLHALNQELSLLGDILEAEEERLKKLNKNPWNDKIQSLKGQLSTIHAIIDEMDTLEEYMKASTTESVFDFNA